VNKIEIGWIGRHLYLPCPLKDNNTNLIQDCGRETECQINPKCTALHDPNADELTNFLKQY
jgi:hypothetical protein